MNPSPPSDNVRILARQLLAVERNNHGSAHANLIPAERVCEALRRPLCTLAGTIGFRELLKRALVLARRPAPALSAVGVNRDGSFEGLAKVALNLNAEAEVALISEFLGLLVVLIGEGLTVGILNDVWPGLNSVNTEISGDGANEPRQ